jgi:hypothetical protein
MTHAKARDAVAGFDRALARDAQKPLTAREWRAVMRSLDCARAVLGNTEIGRRAGDRARIAWARARELESTQHLAAALTSGILR